MTFKTAADELQAISEDVRRLTRRTEQLSDELRSVPAIAPPKEKQPRRRQAVWTTNSFRTRPELVKRVQAALTLATRKEAEGVLAAVIAALEDTLVENIEADGYQLKLGSFGKLVVQHKPGILRKIPFTGETKVTSRRRKVKFIGLGKLRQLEKVNDSATGG